MNKVKQFNNSLEMYEKTFQLCSQLLITHTTTQSQKSLVFNCNLILIPVTTGNVQRKQLPPLYTYTFKNLLYYLNKRGLTQEFCGIKLTSGWQTWCWI